MRKTKRNLSNRAYNRGYQAGVCGRSRDICPYTSHLVRQDWLNGWRDGRSEQWNA